MLEFKILEELTIFMFSMDNDIITCNSTKSNDVKEIEKAIEYNRISKNRDKEIFIIGLQ